MRENTTQDSEPTDVNRAPSRGAAVSDRFSSDEIFHRILAAANHELETGPRELFFSGLAAGFAISLTFLLYASGMAQAEGFVFLGALLYPLGFIYIILGDYQLYTENTLPPVALVLERLTSIPSMLVIWGIVLLGNIVGGFVGALTLAYTGVLSPDAADMAVTLAMKGVETGWWALFFKAVFAGLVVAGVVWVDHAARDTVSRLILVYVAFLAIPLGGLFHSVVSATEAMYLILLGELTLYAGFTTFFLPVLLGNTVGGVLLVTVVNYRQTADRTFYDEDGTKLSVKTWLFGRSW